MTALDEGVGPSQRLAAQARQRLGEFRRLGTKSAGATRFLDRPFASVQLLLLAAGGLLVFGVLMSVSTTIAAAHDGSGASIWAQVVKEGIFIAIGVPLFWLAVCLPPRGYRVLAYPFLALSLIALLAVLVPGIGVGTYGARRWIDLGPLQLQPSELGKIALLLWGGDLLARKQQLGTLRRARHLFIPLLPGFAVVAGLIMLEPDLGTTCALILVLLGLLWMVGMPMRYFAALVTALAGAVTILAFAAPYRWERMITFLHPFKDARNSGFHTVEGLYALASGGVFGVGLGQGTSKYGWVPNASSDYVFAIVGEELGLLGCLAVLALFALLAYTGMRIARRNVDPFVRIVSGAATIWLCGQALINVGYVTGMLPVTGIPLPFISAGGTSLLACFLILGMLVSFARHETPAVAAGRRAERRGTRTRLERLLHIPVAKQYIAPRKRRTPGTSGGPAGRVATGRTRGAPATAAARESRPSVPAAQAASRSSEAARAARSSSPSRPTLAATGTDGTPGRVR